MVAGVLISLAVAGVAAAILSHIARPWLAGIARGLAVSTRLIGSALVPARWNVIY